MASLYRPYDDPIRFDGHQGVRGKFPPAVAAQPHPFQPAFITDEERVDRNGIRTLDRPDGRAHAHVDQSAKRLAVLADDTELPDLTESVVHAPGTFSMRRPHLRSASPRPISTAVRRKATRSPMYATSD